MVAGTAGQVVVLQMEREQREADLKVSDDSCSSSHSSALIIIVHVVWILVVIMGTMCTYD